MSHTQTLPLAALTTYVTEMAEIDDAREELAARYQARARAARQAAQGRACTAPTACTLCQARAALVRRPRLTFDGLLAAAASLASLVVWVGVLGL